MKEGFTMFNDTYAAIPYGKQYLIIHNGQQLDQIIKKVEEINNQTNEENTEGQ